MSARRFFARRVTTAPASRGAARAESEHSHWAQLERAIAELAESSHQLSRASLAILSAMSDPVADELLRLRMSIDNMDAALVHLLAERFKVTKQVGELKAANGLPPADPVREAEQIERLRALAEEAHLDPEFAEKFLNFVVAEVVRHHEAALSQNASSDA
jgi:chorismate mutase